MTDAMRGQSEPGAMAALLPASPEASRNPDDVWICRDEGKTGDFPLQSQWASR